MTTVRDQAKDEHDLIFSWSLDLRRKRTTQNSLYDGGAKSRTFSGPFPGSSRESLANGPVFVRTRLPFAWPSALCVGGVSFGGGMVLGLKILACDIRSAVDFLGIGTSYLTSFTLDVFTSKIRDLHALLVGT